MHLPSQGAHGPWGRLPDPSRAGSTPPSNARAHEAPVGDPPHHHGRRHDLSYLTSGDDDAAPLLLLHGTFWSRVWEPLLPDVGHTARCIALDLPGFGHSAGELTVKQMTILALAQTVLAAADALGLDTFDVAGHDIGGGIA